MQETSYFDDAKTDFVQSAKDQAGLEISNLIPDGQRHRCPVIGKAPNNTSGSYRFHSDYPCSGHFENFVTGESSNWTSKKRKNITPEQKAAYQKEADINKAKRAEEEAQEHAEAAQKAQKMLSAATAAPPDSPYLESKGIKPIAGLKTNGETLLVPVLNVEGAVQSLQLIYPTQTKEKFEKRFLKGGNLHGGFFPIKPENEQPDAPIYIVEGVSTGASVHEATGNTVLCAFSVGRLMEVAKIARSKYPAREIIIAGDNDQKTEGNPGRTKAEKVAKAINAKVVVPLFMDEPEASDFNDLHVIAGIDVVKEQLNRASAPVEVLPPVKEEIAKDLDFEADGKGRPYPTLPNFKKIMEFHDIKVRYNQMTREEEYTIPNAKRCASDRRMNYGLTLISDVCCREGYPRHLVNEMCSSMAAENPYHPAKEWIESRAWDGKQRLFDLFDTVETKELPHLKLAFMLRWFLQAVAALYDPNFSPSGVLVFQGGQGLGKTMWFRSLTGGNKSFAADGIDLNPRDKDSKTRFLSFWLIELGELDATFNKSHIANLKQFLTSDKDKIRQPYAAKHEIFKRKTVAFASVNDERFLVDRTGNRRFWALACTKINYLHDFDMQQVWSEVLHYFRIYQKEAVKGEPHKFQYHLSSAELKYLNANNKLYQEACPIEEKFTTLYDIDGPLSDTGWKNATELLEELGLQADARNCRRMGQVCKEYGFQRKTYKGGLKKYHLPAKRGMCA